MTILRTIGRLLNRAVGVLTGAPSLAELDHAVREHEMLTQRIAARLADEELSMVARVRGQGGTPRE